MKVRFACPKGCSRINVQIAVEKREFLLYNVQEIIKVVFKIMSWSRYIKRLASVGIAAVMLFLLCACGSDKGSSSNTQSGSSDNAASSAQSSLVPVSVFFPDKYIKLHGDSLGDVTVKGNVAIRSDGKSSRRFDPNSGEGEIIDEPLEFESGFGAGSDIAGFVDQFDLKWGYCLAVGSDGNAVDFSEIGTKAAKVTAVLSLSDDGNVSYLMAARIADTVLAIESGSSDESVRSSVGNDFLIVTAESDNLKTVSRFTVSHYTF